MSSAAEILQHVERGSDLWTVIATLDSWGITVSSTRISLWTVLVAVVVLIGVLLLARLAIRLACWFIARMTRLDTAQRLLAQKLVSIAVWVIAFLIAIDALGIDLTALAVFSGAFGLALGFGLQKTFGNLLAGIILLMDRSIKPGDVIAINDGISNTVGQVKKIGIRAVSVTTRDKKEYLIPNENLMINQVENWSYSSREVRIRVPVIIAPTSDLELAEKLMLEAARASPRVLDKPPPAAWLTEVTEAGVAFEIRVWIDDPEEGLASVRSDILKRLWKLFQQDGVELPDRAQRNLYLQDSEQFQQLVAAISKAMANRK
jgi:small-conductance mechanosensitive channel